MNSVINEFCKQGSAYAPRMKTDTLFPLCSNYNIKGRLADEISFITDWQLCDAKTWKLFVNQFRQGNVDDADKGWRCEYWGKMMRGGCFVYQVTGDKRLYAALEETVYEMLTVQDKLGRFATYSVEKEFDGWDLWGRKYILLGMQYFIEICKDEALIKKIVAALCRHADYIISKIGPKNEGKIEINEATNFWLGMNSSSILEPFVRLYNITGEKKYLDFSSYIVERGGCSGGNLFELAYEDQLDPYQYPVTKAYEMMSCFEGLLEYYRVTGIEKYKEAVIRFADRVFRSDVTIIGCCGCTHELFDHSAVEQFNTEKTGIMQETCVTVTWMKLCYQLLCLTGKAKYAEWMENSVFNALIGAVNDDKVTLNKGLPFDSYSPLRAGTRGKATGGYKVMENGTYYGCCACIGAAGLGLAGMSAIMYAKDGICINQYLTGKTQILTPEGKTLDIITEGDVYGDGCVKITVAPEQPEKFTVSVRLPIWSKNTKLTLNGQSVSCEGEYASFDRIWNAGDTLILSLDMSVRKVSPEEFGTTAPFTALRRGCVLLARDARTGDDVESAFDPAVDDNGVVAATDNAECAIHHNNALSISDGKKTLILIDYASAGKTWFDDSKMCVWSSIDA